MIFGNKPWDYHPDLTQEHLTTVGNLILRGRRAAFDRYSPSVGCNGWTLGCEGFQFGRHQILAAAESSGFEWLTIIDPSMHFVFKIGGVPVRFYRGEPDDPNERTLRQSYAELAQLSFIFEGVSAGADLAYRFAVETDIEGDVSNISFVGIRGGQPVFVWEVPLDVSVRSIAEFGLARSEGVELPKPAVRLPGAETRKSQAND